MSAAGNRAIHRLWTQFPLRAEQAWLNWLLLAVPAAIALQVAGANQVAVFCASAVGIVPLAGVLGDATEVLAARSGPTLGGLINATMGNATELIISFFLIANGHVRAVKASLSGSILGNLLLVLGVAVVAGCWGKRKRTFSREMAGTNGTMLFIAVVALVMPAVYDLSVYGSLQQQGGAVQRLSLWTAAVLIVIYGISLLYMLRTRDLVVTGEVEHGDRPGGIGRALTALVLATGLIAWLSEMLVGELDAVTSALGMSEFFVGAIVVAIVGNAAEHSTAIIVARRGQMDLALAIAIGSSAQIALFVAPVLVFCSVAMGHPMTLVFNGFEVAAIFLSVLIVHMISADGETTWFEGAQLIAVYLIVAVSFFFVP